MIRTGSSSSGVSSILNPFHSQVIQTGSFFTNVGGGPPPPSLLSKMFASEYTDPPLFRIGGTVFVDPYGFGTLPSTVSTLYFNVIMYRSAGLSIKWANSYSGTATTLYPEGVFEDLSNSGTQDQGFYIRVNNSRRPYRIFSFQATNSQFCFAIIGPENVTKVAPIQGGFQMSGLEGSSLGRILVTNSGFFNIEFTKSERVIETVVNTIWDQKNRWIERDLVNPTPDEIDKGFIYFFR